MSHKVYKLSGCEVFPSLFVIFFIKSSYQLFKDIAHTKITQAFMENFAFIVFNIVHREIDFRRAKSLYNAIEDFCLIKRIKLISKFEFRNNVFDISTKAIKIIFKIDSNVFRVV